jgi:cell division protein FtsQ
VNARRDTLVATPGARARRASSATPSKVTRAQSERVTPPRRRLRRLTKWTLSLGLIVTALALGAQWTLHQSFFRVQHVTFVGLRHESAAAVLKASGLASHPAMIGVNGATIEKNLSSFTWISALQVTKHWPNSVVVSVHESLAVAVAFTAAHVLEFVDDAGRALGPAPHTANLPTLTYLHPTGATWPFERAGRGAAYVASQLPRAFSSQVSVITEDAHGDVTLKMTTPVSFLLGPAQNLHAKFVAIASVIAHSTLAPGDVVDVSVPDELAVTPPTKS